MAKTCPHPKPPKKHIEAKGQKEGTVTAIQTSRRTHEDHVEEFRRPQQQAELTSAVGRTSGRLSGMSAPGSAGRPRLGPTVFVEVEVNEVKTHALVNTGSPATIITLDFVLQILAEQRDWRLTPTKWKEETIRRFSPPNPSLLSETKCCTRLQVTTLSELFHQAVCVRNSSRRHTMGGLGPT